MTATDNTSCAETPRTTTGAGSNCEPPPSPRRWLMIGMAFLATLINYLDRQTLSVAIALLSVELHLGNQSYGRILAAFMLAYTVMNGASGVILDRLGTRVGYALCMAWWSTAAVLHGLTRGPWSLGLFRFLLGVGEAGNWPAATKLVTEWFPTAERALASGIFNSGAAVGTVLSMFLVPRIVLLVGSRAAFVIIGALGYLWLAVWWLAYRTPARVQGEASRVPAAPWRVVRTRFLACFMLSCALLDPVWYFYIFWFPKFLSDVHGFDLARIGNTAWIPFVTAAAGNWVGGWFTGVLIKRGITVSVARKTGITFSALLMTSAVPAVLTGNSAVAIAMISVATFGYTSFVANTLAFPAEVFPKNLVASAYGLAGVGSGFGGMVFSWIEGELIGKFGYAPVFIGCAITPLVALSVILFLMGPLRPHPDFQESTCPPSAGAPTGET